MLYVVPYRTGTVQYGMVLYGTVPYRNGTVRYLTGTLLMPRTRYATHVRYGTVRYGTSVVCCTLRYRTVRYGMVLYRTTP